MKNVLTFTSLAASLLLLFSTATAAPRPGTVAMDYRNAPQWQTLTDYERVVLSPRAGTARGGWAVDSLRAHGVKTIIWLQPNISTWQGQPITDWPVDAAMWPVALAYNAIHKDSTGAYIPLYQGPGWYSLDFSVPGFPEALAGAVGASLPPADGLLHDHGCCTSEWMAQLRNVPGIDWPAWSNGYYRYRAGLGDATLGIPQISECNVWNSWIPQVSAGILLEGVGPPQNLTSYTRAWDLLQAKPLSILLCQSPVPQHRRVLSTMALVAGCGFQHSPTFFQGGGYSNTRDIEHFELGLGTPGTSIIVLAPGVFYRPFSRGWALVNLAAQTYSFQNFKVAPNDGLACQTRDSAGRWIVKRTNQGR